MGDQHLDYHVGLLRGFVLAHNAPTQILHALDVLLTDYRSKAGRLIGEAEPERPPAAPVREIPASLPVVMDRPSMPEKSAKMVFWNKIDDDALEEMYCTQGLSPHVIATKINRTAASVSARIYNKGLKRGG